MTPAAAPPRGPAEERGGDGVGEQVHRDAEARQDRRRLLGERPARVAAVEADHDAALPRVGSAWRPAQQVDTETPRGLRHDQAVHPREAGLRASAEARGAELQGPGEAVGQVMPRPLVAGLDAVEQVPQLRAGLGVGILGEKVVGEGHGIGHRRPF
jgi:hypothetical protein